MARTYFNGWMHGHKVEITDWYCDNLIYVNIRFYWSSTAVDRPDNEKSFLLKVDRPERFKDYIDTIVNTLFRAKEARKADGSLAVTDVHLPAIGF